MPSGSCEGVTRNGEMAAFTVRLAELLITVPTVLLTIARNWELLSAVVAAGVVYVGAVAPDMAAPFFCHW